MSTPEIPRVRVNPACGHCEVVGLCLESIGQQVGEITDAARASQSNWQAMQTARADEWERLQNYANSLNESMMDSLRALERDIEVFGMYNRDCPGETEVGCSLDAEEQYRMLPLDLTSDPRVQSLKNKAFGSPDW